MFISTCRQTFARSGNGGSRARWLVHHPARQCASARGYECRRECRGRCGRFRQDLLFRLNTIEIHIPPLRDRREDVDLLAQHFLHGYSQRYRKSISGFDTAAIRLFMSMPAGQRPRIDHAVERGVSFRPAHPSARLISACVHRLLVNG